MSGGPGDDIQNGGDGNDLIFANVGVDTSFGGPGNDVLWALAKADVASIGDPVGDSLDGGDGDDVFRTRDGEVDKITCGPGNDKAILDNYDVITDAGAGQPERLVRARRAPRHPRQGPRQVVEGRGQRGQLAVRGQQGREGQPREAPRLAPDPGRRWRVGRHATPDQATRPRPPAGPRSFWAANILAAMAARPPTPTSNPLALMIGDVLADRRAPAPFPPGELSFDLRRTNRYVKDPLGVLLESYERYGPVFTLKILHHNVVFMLGPEANHHVLVSQRGQPLLARRPLPRPDPADGRRPADDRRPLPPRAPPRDAAGVPQPADRSRPRRRDGGGGRARARAPSSPAR